MDRFGFKKKGDNLNSKIERSQGKQLSELKRIQDRIDAKESKQSNIWHRFMIMRRQKLHNNQNEFDRIRNQLESHSYLNGETKQNGLERSKKLQELGAKAMNNIPF